MLLAGSGVPKAGRLHPHKAKRTLHIMPELAAIRDGRLPRLRMRGEESSNSADPNSADQCAGNAGGSGSSPYRKIRQVIVFA